MTGSSSYPQASIFFKADLKNKIDDTLLKMTASVNKANEDPNTTAKNAVTMYDAIKNLGEEILTSAIPNANFKIEENQKSAIEFLRKYV